MSMQVDIDAYLTIVNLLLDGFLNRPDRWLLLLRWIDVVAIQILSERVKSVIAAVHTVGVQHRHNFKDKTVAKHLPLYALLIRQELPDAVKDKRSWCFTGMDA